MAPVVGIDGCRRGWVAVVLADGAPPQAHLLSRIADVAAFVPDAAVIGVDMPIGLPAAGWRSADVLARRALGVRRSSVFAVPPAAVLAAVDHRTANEVAVDLTGVGISRQAYGLRTKIAEVATWLAEAGCAVHEVHPELSFAELIGRPATASKKSWTGIAERRTALGAAGIDVDRIDRLVGGAVAPDDLLDAAAVAWSARRIAAGIATSRPDPPERGADGTPMAIWT